MKDLIRLSIYSGGAALSILILYYLAISGKVSGNIMVTAAVLLIVVIPTVLIIAVAKKERARALEQEKKEQGQ